MPPLRVVLASGNPGKAQEFSRLLTPAMVVEPLPAGVGLPEETADTFRGNARLKAEAVFAALGGDTAVLADDSGLEVTALGGAPGVRSARYAGEGATDEENVARLLAELKGAADRSARFVCDLVLLVPGPGGMTAREAEGELEGEIVTSPRGLLGFGYDPVFRPRGWTSTLAEVAPADKDGVSHRGAAARALLARLREL